jgi:TetR/AcrR family transcriptional repressor of nem operon
MLAAEYATLPKPMQKELKHYFEENERWLCAVLEDGRRAGELRFAGAARDVARLLVSSLEGAMMLARSYGDVGRFRSVADRLIADLAA